MSHHIDCDVCSHEIGVISPICVVPDDHEHHPGGTVCLNCFFEHVHRLPITSEQQWVERRQSSPIETELKVGNVFLIDDLEYTISQVDAFGWVRHYGVTWTDRKGNFNAGWMPVALVHEMRRLS